MTNREMIIEALNEGFDNPELNRQIREKDIGCPRMFHCNHVKDAYPCWRCVDDWLKEDCGR